MLDFCKRHQGCFVDGFKWIVMMPGYLGGRPAIYGKRMSVEQVLVLLANGTTPQELKEHYELDLTVTKECLLYASKIMESQALSRLRLGAQQATKGE